MFTAKRLSRVTLGMTIVLVAVGGFTRGSGSGFGCADRWPLCEDGLLGGLLPRGEYHMIVEWSHRWIATIVGVLAVATAIAAWREHRRERRISWTAIAAVAVTGFQGLVGRAVVKGDLDADLVSFHLTVSMLVVALLTVVAVATAGAPTRDRARWDRWGFLLGAAAVGALSVLILGSYVHNLYVPGWPLVTNTLFPDLSNRFVAVHFLHRVLAAAVFGYLVWLFVAARREGRPRLERNLVATALAAFTLNAGLGAAHVFTEVGSSLLVAAHLVVAAISWAALVAATGLAVWASKDDAVVVETAAGVPR